MKPSPPRSGRARGPAILTACAGTYDGTTDIVEAMIHESTHYLAWRPVRACALMAWVGENTGRDHVWMTTAEFVAWRDLHFPHRQRGVQRAMEAAVGIGRHRRDSILAGEPVAKDEALACAHYALGLPLPVEPGDVRGFAAWVTPRFGAVREVGKALLVAADYIPDRMRGYDLTSAGARQRLPDAGLIRALDWVWRLGPFSPYGQRLDAPPFPAEQDAAA